MLAFMDGVVPHEGLCVIMTTNQEPDWFDPALLREGRINHVIEMPNLDAAGRAELLKQFACPAMSTDDEITPANIFGHINRQRRLKQTLPRKPRSQPPWKDLKTNGGRVRKR